MSCLVAVMVMCMASSSPQWSGYGGYSGGWGSMSYRPQGQGRWHYLRPYYQQFQQMPAVYSPAYGHYINYYQPYQLEPIDNYL